jgi:hypothetical protein
MFSNEAQGQHFKYSGEDSCMERNFSIYRCRAAQALIPKFSISDKAGVETAGDGRVSCAFDDGAAIGKQCHFVRRAPEF